MDFILNILNLSVCSAAMAYCYVLSKRIASFRNMKDGIGALIEEMIRTTTELQGAFEHTKHNIDKQSNAIQDKIDEGTALSEYLGNLLMEIETTSKHVAALQQKIYQTPVPKSNYITDRQHNSQARQEYNNLNTIPNPHQQNKASHTMHHPSLRDEKPYNLEDNFNPDPLADVMPAGFEELYNRRQLKRRYSNEEYL